VNNPNTLLTLVYIDDVVDAIIDFLRSPIPGLTEGRILPEYSIRLEDLANQIRAFERCRDVLVSERVGSGLVRALYATFISYLPSGRYSYALPRHSDSRGVFVEFLKTKDSGQFSFFTAHPGITRGGHYHHTKSEKFLVLQGDALFRFRHIITGEVVELRISGTKSEVVDTIPGWAHDITNIGTSELLVMLWANENFDRDRPDTVADMV
jgi:UDP-2-acetamido-2,6-beta-L-arabino-hexul-4-ose reductase